MAVTPEIQRPEAPVVTQIPENVDLGPKATEAGVEQVPSTPTTPPSVQQSPQQSTVVPVPAPPLPTGPSITLPADPVQLTTLSKGSTNNSVTWFAAYWLRMLKKALKKHWNVIVGGHTNSA